MAGAAGFGELAGTLDKVQLVIISPMDNVFLPNIVEGTNQLHSFKVCGMEFGHHGLELSTVEHSH